MITKAFFTFGLLVLATLSNAEDSTINPLAPTLPSRFICTGSVWLFDDSATILTEGKFQYLYNYYLGKSRLDQLFEAGTYSVLAETWFASESGTDYAYLEPEDAYFHCNFVSKYDIPTPSFLKYCDFVGSDIIAGAPVYEWSCDQQYASYWTDAETGMLVKSITIAEDEFPNDVKIYNECHEVSSFPDLGVFDAPYSFDCM